MVEELLPTAVALMAQVNVDKRIAFWLDGLLDECHPCLAGGSTTFFHVAFRTGADHIFPGGFAAYALRDNMVK